MPNLNQPLKTNVYICAHQSPHSFCRQMQGYLNKSLCSEMQCSTGEIYISQSPHVQANPVSKCILKSMSCLVHLEKVSLVTTISILKRNGKMFLKKDSSSNMIPLEQIWSEYHGERFTMHHFPYGPVTRFSNREKHVTFDIE